MDILRVTLRWNGFAGAPGYSNFHFAADPGFWDGGFLGDDAKAAANSAVARVAEGTLQIGPSVPASVSFSVEPEVLVIDSDTGEIQGQIQRDPVSLGGPSGSGGYSAASGAVINWNTSDYRAGRRIRGRTFMVPLSSASYDAEGTLSTAALEDMRGFADALIGDGGQPELGVWSRPRNGAGGVFATVVSASVPDKVAVLRSRRD